MGIGEWAALVAALLWTFSSMFWGSIRLSAWNINFCKCAIGSVLVGGHLLVATYFFDEGGLVAPPKSWGLLGLSSLIGIVAGDTFYFRCLQILGPRRALMIFTTSPIFSVAFGWLFLKETMLPLALLGVLITVAGVVVVIGDRKAPSEGGRLMPGTFQMGLATGLAGSACNAIGAVFSKMAMFDRSEAICGFLEATWIRLLLSASMIFFVIVGQRQLVPLWQRIQDDRIWGRLFLGTALGTWLGIGASMLAYKETTNIAVAQTLMSTCPLFAIPVCWFLYKQGATVIGVIGTLIAILGIWMVVKN